MFRRILPILLVSVLATAVTVRPVSAQSSDVKFVTATHERTDDELKIVFSVAADFYAGGLQAQFFWKGAGRNELRPAGIGRVTVRGAGAGYWAPNGWVWPIEQRKTYEMIWKIREDLAGKQASDVIAAVRITGAPGSGVAPITETFGPFTVDGTRDEKAAVSNLQARAADDRTIELTFDLQAKGLKDVTLVAQYMAARWMSYQNLGGPIVVGKPRAGITVRQRANAALVEGETYRVRLGPASFNYRNEFVETEFVYRKNGTATVETPAAEGPAQGAGDLLGVQADRVETPSTGTENRSLERQVNDIIAADVAGRDYRRDLLVDGPPTYDDQALADQLRGFYRQHLNRDADARGLAYYYDRVKNDPNFSAEDARRAIERSPEACHEASFDDLQQGAQRMLEQVQLPVSDANVRALVHAAYVKAGEGDEALMDRLLILGTRND